jgi:hypothetical protein
VQRLEFLCRNGRLNASFSESKISPDDVTFVENTVAFVDDASDGSQRKPAHRHRDAYSIAMMFALNSQIDTPRSIFVTMNKSLIKAVRKLSNNPRFIAAPSYVQDVYGTAWGMFYEARPEGPSSMYLSLISKATTLSETHLSQLIYKDDLNASAVDLRTLSKAIEDVASLAETFHYNVAQNIRNDNNLAASSMHELASKVEGGASNLHELVELLIHHVTNWPRPSSDNDNLSHGAYV